MGCDYFDNLRKEEHVLHEHGFDHYPTEDEALRYVFSVSDRLDALCRAVGVTVVQDHRGRWRASSTGGGDPRGR